jgi:hypothetical protein
MHACWCSELCFDMHTALPEHQLTHIGAPLHAPAAALPELANPGGPPFLSAYWKFEDAETGGLWSVGVHNNSTFGAAEYYEGIYASSGELPPTSQRWCMLPPKLALLQNLKSRCLFVHRRLHLLGVRPRARLLLRHRQRHVLGPRRGR